MKQSASLALLAALAVGAGSTFAADKMDDTKGMNMGSPVAPSVKTHHAVGVVKALDTKANTVTFAHEPVKSMSWPAMKMTFSVKDKMLFGQLAEGKKVEFDFVQEGKRYVVTAVK